MSFSPPETQSVSRFPKFVGDFGGVAAKITHKISRGGFAAPKPTAGSAFTLALPRSPANPVGLRA
jgi:hypothetical protein